MRLEACKPLDFGKVWAYKLEGYAARSPTILIQLKKHSRPVWYRVRVQYTRQDCSLSFPIQAHSLENARLKTLHQYLRHREIDVLSVRPMHKGR